MPKFKNSRLNGETRIEKTDIQNTSIQTYHISIKIECMSVIPIKLLIFIGYKVILFLISKMFKLQHELVLSVNSYSSYFFNLMMFLFVL